MQPADGSVASAPAIATLWQTRGVGHGVGGGVGGEGAGVGRGVGGVGDGVGGVGLGVGDGVGEDVGDGVGDGVGGVGGGVGAFVELHAVAPALDSCPGGHVAHEVLAKKVVASYLPAGQRRHFATPEVRAGAYCPSPQYVQCRSPPPPAVPLAQVWQPCVGACAHGGCGSGVAFGFGAPGCRFLRAFHALSCTACAFCAAASCPANAAEAMDEHLLCLPSGHHTHAAAPALD